MTDEAQQPDAPRYMRVTLSRRVEIEGHVYAPGVAHIVDQATRDAMGDAIATEAPANV